MFLSKIIYLYVIGVKFEISTLCKKMQNHEPGRSKKSRHWKMSEYDVPMYPKLDCGFSFVFHRYIRTNPGNLQFGLNFYRNSSSKPSNCIGFIVCLTNGPSLSSASCSS